MERGDIDIYPEYTGTGLINILGEPAIDDPQAAYDKVKRMYQEKKQIVWLAPFGFNNTYTLTMRSDEAEHLGINTISDLGSKASSLTLGATHEFLERADGKQGLEQKYGFKFATASGMEPALTYAAPIIRADVLQKHPEIAEALQVLAGALDDKEMTKLNGKVDLEKQDPKAVAKEWLQSKGLVK